MYRTLEHLRGISPDECRRLRAIGVRHTNQFLHFLTLAIDRRRIARRTGMPEPRLLQLARQCAMLEISGMDHHRNVIHRLGIDGLKTLKRQDPAELHHQLVEAVGPARAPALPMVEYWVSQARAIDMIEEDEPASSKTSPSLIS